MARSVFAMEVCARLDRAPGLHQSLAQRLSVRPLEASLADKWAFYKGCGDDLIFGLDAIDRGCWDFFDDDNIAKKVWADYCRALVEHEGARKEPLPLIDPYRGGEPRFMTFTVAMLLVRGTPSERMMSTACSVPDPQLWMRGTFQRILGVFGALSFAGIEGDVAYLLPRQGEYALTSGDLATEKFNYLRPLV